MKRIVLASTSPRRKQLLEQLGITFETFSPDFDEESVHIDAPSDLVMALSKGKAEAARLSFPNSIIIAADTVVAFEEMVVSKPETPENARRMLSRLMGNVNSVYTGYTILDTESGKSVTGYVETKVHFKKFSNDLMERYIATGEPLDKAGGYGIQGKGAMLVDRIEGDYSNVVGLPVGTIAEKLEELGVKVL